MNFDLVSDLHIDFWDEDYHYDWLEYQSSDILVVAGDTSDYVDFSCEYLHSLTTFYKTILVVDGNHEHQPKYPDIDYSIENWHNLTSLTKGIHNLSSSSATIGNTRFIGANGWWTFDFGEPVVSEHDCIEHVTSVTNFNKKLVKDMKYHANADSQWIADQVLSAQWDMRVEHIVVVTHTLPDKDCISWNVYPIDNRWVGLYGNSYQSNVFENDIHKKIRYWCFGHNHDAKCLDKNYYTLVSNPRGRVKDYNRTEYKPLSIEL